MSGRERPVVRLHMWLETDEGVFFGVGRVQLLELVDELGSLRAAADRLGMSYRAAWGKIRKTEKIIGFSLIEKPAGNRGGYRLTEFGKLLVENFRDWYADVETRAVARAREIFPYDAERYRAPKGQDASRALQDAPREARKEDPFSRRSPERMVRAASGSR
ncbi:putative transcriptional regulator, ModE family [Desulfovibrio sp. X2]|uniref:winged helix-turn-helix domain-containing protein n=1 Tax=Desulfovibrio sp. X2 TaxID=941449 RepID=UPI000358BB55|nr:LysR family transcriptional regulator [Desulfovibrio sp. X2]EPR44396.1 putative transcriptional regulator, ModE family [Desulfovibrio sp. X2]